MGPVFEIWAPSHDPAILSRRGPRNKRNAPPHDRTKVASYRTSCGCFSMYHVIVSWIIQPPAKTLKYTTTGSGVQAI